MATSKQEDYRLAARFPGALAALVVILVSPTHDTQWAINKYGAWPMFKAAACPRNVSVVQKGGHFSTDLSHEGDFLRALHKTEKSILSEFIHPSTIFRTQTSSVSGNRFLHPHLPACPKPTPLQCQPIWRWLSALKWGCLSQGKKKIPKTRLKWKANKQQRNTTNSKGTQQTNLCRQIQEQTLKQGSCKFTVHVRLVVIAKPFHWWCRCGDSHLPSTHLVQRQLPVCLLHTAFLKSTWDNRMVLACRNERSHPMLEWGGCSSGLRAATKGKKGWAKPKYMTRKEQDTLLHPRIE